MAGWGGRAGQIVVGTVLLLLALAGCGGTDDSGSDGGAGAAPTPEQPSALLAAIEADGTDTERLRVGTQGEVGLAVVDDGDEVVAYLCDGFAGEWFTGPSRGELESASGTQLSLDGNTATVTPSDGDPYPISLADADGDDDLVRFVDDAGVGGLVVHDGVVRGTVTLGDFTMGTRLSPVVESTTTSAPPPEDQFVFLGTVELDGVVRTTTRFDLRCDVAAEEVAQAYSQAAQNVESMFARLVREVSAELAEPEATAEIQRLEQLRDAMLAQLALQKARALEEVARMCS